MGGRARRRGSLFGAMGALAVVVVLGRAAIAADGDHVVTRSVPVLSEATDVAVDPLRDRQFVALEALSGDPSAGAVAIVEEVGGAVVRTPRGTAGSPTGLGVDPTRDRLYVASQRGGLMGGHLEVIDATTHAEVAHLNFASRTTGLAVDPGVQRVFVTLNGAGIFGSDGVMVFNQSTNVSDGVVTVTGVPRAVAVDLATHRAYVLGVTTSLVGIPTGTLDVLDGAAAFPTLVATVPIGSDPIALAVDQGRGRVFVVDGAGGNLSVVDLAAGAVVGTIAAPGARQVAVDHGTGLLYLTGPDGVVVLRSADLSPVASVPVAGGAVGVVADATTSRAFATSEVGQLLTIEAAPHPDPGVVSPPPTATPSTPTTARPGRFGPSTTPPPAALTASPTTTTTAPTTTSSTAPGDPSAQPADDQEAAAPPSDRLTGIGGERVSSVGDVPLADGSADELIESVVAPSEVPFGLRAVAPSALLALLLLALLALPVSIVNKTAEINADEIAARVGRLGRTLRLSSVADAFASLPFAQTTALAAVMSAVLYGSLQPTFGLDRHSMALILGVAGALMVLNGASILVVTAHLRRVHRATAYVRALPGFVLVAAACVVVSRVAGLQPGLLLGPLLAVAIVQPLRRDQIGEAKARAWTVVAALATVAWLSRSWVVEHAGERGSFVAEVVGTLLTTVVVSGVQGLAYALVPLYFLDGSQIFEWSRPRWAALQALGAFGVVHVLVRSGAPSAALAQRVDELAIMLACYLVAALWFWAWFRFRVAPPPPAPTSAARRACGS